MVSAGSTSTPRVRGQNPGHDQERRFASGSTSDFARVVAGPGAHPGHGWDRSSGWLREVKKAALEDRSTQARGTSQAKEAPKKEETKGDAAKKEPEKAVEAPPPAIPKEVEEKLEKARRAVAEAIVAAQDAGLVETSIDPPPILDILIKGYAIDARTLKNPAAKKTYWAVTPEVFCGFFTGYSKSEFSTINPMNELRIVNPSGGLKAWYDAPRRRC